MAQQQIKDNRQMTPAKIEASVALMKDQGIVDSGEAATAAIGAMSQRRIQDFYNQMVNAGRYQPRDVDPLKVTALRFVNKPRPRPESAADEEPVMGTGAPKDKRAAIEVAPVEAGREGEPRFVRPADLAPAADEAALTAVARAADAHGCAMGLVPQGTFNYFARTHGLPQDAAEATLVLLHGAPVAVQVGVVDEPLFPVSASLGLIKPRP